MTKYAVGIYLEYVLWDMSVRVSGRKMNTEIKGESWEERQIRLSSCRDTIADLLGSYISISRLKKYEVLEKFSEAEVKFNRTIRQSFVN